MSRSRGRSWRFIASLLLTLLGLIAMSMSACGGEDEPSSPGTGASSSPTPKGRPGTITLTGSAPITGQAGKVLLILAMSDSGRPMARACVQIASDRFTIPSTVMTDQPADQNPCGSATADTVLASGTYTISAGIYKPPAQQPEKESKQTVQVTAGAPLAVALDAASLSR